MAFDWHEYLVLAQWLLANPPPGVSEEAVRRAAERTAPRRFTGAGPRLVSRRSLLREQRLDLLVAQLLLAVVGVDHQRLARRRHPHEVVAHRVHLLQLRVLLQQVEVGVALR